MKIRTKLILALLFTALVPLAVASVLSYYLAETSLKDQALRQLESVAEIQRNRVEASIDQNLERLALVASRTQLRVSLRNYIQARSGAEREKMNAILFDARSSIASFEDISVVALDGEVMASTNLDEIGANHASEGFFTAGQVASRGDLLFLGDDDRPRFQLAGPLILEGELLGVIAIVSDADSITSAITDYAGLGDTGETQLAARNEAGDALFLTPLRFDQDAALSRTVGKEELQAPITQALVGHEGLLEEAADYRGEPVLAATAYIERTGWGLVAKIDKTEAFAPVRRLRNVLLSVAAASSLAVILAALYLSRSLSRPIVSLARTAAKIGEGDLSQRAELTSRDEIGALGQAFNRMADGLIQATVGLEQTVRERTEELARSNRELDEFAYVISHDLKEPLRAIDAFSGFLSKGYGDRLDDDGNKYLRLVRESAVRMKDLIEDLLQLSRVGRGQRQREAVAVESLLEDVKKDLEFAITDKNVDLRTQSSLPTITCDPVHIKQVFENLISNAIKYNDKPEPIVEITCRSDNGVHTFSVRDNGPGIAEKFHGKIFRIFQRLVRREDYEGTGIGLTICKKVVELHGGRIWVESSPERGSTFLFTVPKEMEQTKKGKERMDARAPGTH